MLREAAARVQAFKTPFLPPGASPADAGSVARLLATPHRTAGHLLLAAMNTAYILVGVRLEERDLMAEFGPNCEHYRRRVPMLMPRLFSSGGSVASDTRRGG